MTDMFPSRRAPRLSVLVAVCLLIAGQLTAEPSPDEPNQPARSWGESRAGLALSLLVEDNPRAMGSFRIHPAIANRGKAAVALGKRKDAVAFLFIVQRKGDSLQAYFTEKLTIGKSVDWPAELAGGKAVDLGRRDLADVAVYEYRRGLRMVDGYPQAVDEDKPQQAGTLAEVLARDPSLPVKARLILHVPRGDERSLDLTSNTLTIDLAPPAWKDLSDTQRRAYTDDLLKRFDRDAWSAQRAHREAVGIGKPLLERLIEAAGETRRPGFSRMWLATSLADIRDPNAAAALRELLKDDRAGVRYVVAYHGPKQRSDPLDRAIIASLVDANDTKALAYGLLGFMVHRGEVPGKLLAAGLDSDDPRVRSAATRALKTRASAFNVTRLCRLLSDDSQQVRAAAAKVLGAMGADSDAVIGKLAAALNAEGDLARKAIADALGELTGKDMPYDPSAGKADKQAVIDRWQAWWREKRSE